MMAELILKERESPPIWSLARFKKKLTTEGTESPRGITL